MDWLMIIFAWFVFSIVAAVIANARGRAGTGYFLLSMLLTPLVGIILAAALPNLNVAKDPDAPNANTHVRCPDCRELVRFDAIKCKHCGATLTPNPIALSPISAKSVPIEEAAQDLIGLAKAVGVIVGVFVLSRFAYVIWTRLG